MERVCKLAKLMWGKRKVSIRKKKGVLRLELPMRLKNKYRASNCIEELVIIEKDNQKLINFLNFFFVY